VSHETGLCAIHHAGQNGHVDAIKYLCEGANCDVNIRTTDNVTTLMLACRGGHLDAIRCLYGLGADLLATNRGGMTAAHFAAQEDRHEALALLMELFIEYRKKLIDLQAAAPTKSAATMDAEEEEAEAVKKAAEKTKLLSEPGKRDATHGTVQQVIDMASNNGTRPLHLAAEANCIQTVQYLLSQQCDVHAKDVNGDTPLHKAGRKQNFVVFRMLVAAGGNEHALNSQRESARKLLYDDVTY
jgi:ankyrin repeat protein